MDDGAQIVTLIYHDRKVTFDLTARMWNLNAMFDACQRPQNKEPWRWLADATTADYLQALIEKCDRAGGLNLGPLEVFGGALPERPYGREQKKALAEWVRQVADIAGRAGLIVSRQGRTGGTWAHWQIAAAYAHYLDPHFYLSWNEWALAHSTGAAPAADSSSTLAALAARIAVLEAHTYAPARRGTPRAPTASDHPLHPNALAILAIVNQIGYPVTAAHVVRVLQEQRAGGWSSGRYVSVRMRRLERAGYLVRVVHGVYALPSAARGTDAPELLTQLGDMEPGALAQIASHAVARLGNGVFTVDNVECSQRDAASALAQAGTVSGDPLDDIARELAAMCIGGYATVYGLEVHKLDRDAFVVESLGIVCNQLAAAERIEVHRARAEQIAARWEHPID